MYTIPLIQQRIPIVMKLCFFMHRFDDGGAEKITICLMNELAARGHDVTLAIRYNRGPAKTLLSDAVKILDMQLPDAGKIRKNILNVRYLMRLMKSGNFDVMIPILSDMSQVTSLAKFFSRVDIPVISVVHSTLSVERISFPKVRRALGKFFDRQYNKVITVSESVKRDYIAYAGTDDKHVETVYNPIVNDRMIAQSEERPDHPWLVPERSFVTLVLAGRLNHAKNHPLMFRALSILRRQGDYRLILLGEGEEKEHLKKLAADMGLTDDIDFHGYVTNPHGYMRYCDCVVLSSLYEGLPTVLVEALVSGARVVSVNCKSGPDEILENGKYGILTPPEDAEGLADGVRRAMQQTPDRAFLLRRAMDFSVEKAVDRYEAIFREVTGHADKA